MTAPFIHSLTNVRGVPAVCRVGVGGRYSAETRHTLVLPVYVTVWSRRQKEKKRL